MHPHLHTKDNRGCEDVMNALEECHARGFLYKAVGMCNETKRDLTKCLRAERIERTRQNRAASKAKREHIQQVWAEIEAES